MTGDVRLGDVTEENVSDKCCLVRWCYRIKCEWKAVVRLWVMLWKAKMWVNLCDVIKRRKWQAKRWPMTVCPHWNCARHRWLVPVNSAIWLIFCPVFVQAVLVIKRKKCKWQVLLMWCYQKLAWRLLGVNVYRESGGMSEHFFDIKS